MAAAWACGEITVVKSDRDGHLPEQAYYVQQPVSMLLALT